MTNLESFALVLDSEDFRRVKPGDEYHHSLYYQYHDTDGVIVGADGLAMELTVIVSYEDIAEADVPEELAYRLLKELYTLIANYFFEKCVTMVHERKTYDNLNDFLQ